MFRDWGLECGLQVPLAVPGGLYHVKQAEFMGLYPLLKQATSDAPSRKSGEAHSQSRIV